MILHNEFLSRWNCCRILDILVVVIYWNTPLIGSSGYNLLQVVANE